MAANPTSHSSLTSIHYMWLGDFNRHHPLWDKPRSSYFFTKHNLDLTQPLLNMLSQYNMKMALPPFLPTLCAHSMGNLTRVDNIFCSEDLLDTIIKCCTEDDMQPIKMNHYPIITTFNILAPKAIHPPRLNFRNTDWPEFQQSLKSCLDHLPQPTEIYSVNTFNLKLNNLNAAIQETIKDHVPITKPTPYLKRWWSSILTQEKRLMHKLAWKAKRFHSFADHPIHEEYWLQCNRYADQIKKADHWIDWLEGLNKSSMWQAARFILSPPTDVSRTCIPTLQVKDPITKQVTKEVH